MAARFPRGKQPEFPVYCIGTIKLSDLICSISSTHGTITTVRLEARLYFQGAMIGHIAALRITRSRPFCNVIVREKKTSDWIVKTGNATLSVAQRIPAGLCEI